MSELSQRVSVFLESIKGKGMSSPAGMHWQDFYLLLKAKKQNGLAPPPPLILAASSESSAVKHQRLADQLKWATENGCLVEAMQFLELLPMEHWNTCLDERWNMSSY